MANNPNTFMVVQNSTDESQLLGKFLYYSLADVLVKKEDFERICNALNFPYAGRRISVVDAFKNATGRVMRRTDAGSGGTQEIFRIYCRDNQRAGGTSIPVSWCARPLACGPTAMISLQISAMTATRTGCTTILWRTIRCLMWSSCAGAWSRSSSCSVSALAGARSTRSCCTI